MRYLMSEYMKEKLREERKEHFAKIFLFTSSLFSAIAAFIYICSLGK